MRKLLGWGLLLVVGLGIFGMFATGQKDGVSAPAAKPVAHVTETADETADTPAKGDPECQARWLKAEKAGITYGEGFVGGTATVSVDEATFQSIDYNTKVGLAETFQCAVVGKDHALAKVNFVSNITNKVLAVWQYNRLTVN